MNHRSGFSQARARFGELSADARDYLAGHPYRLVHQYDMREGRYLVRAEVTRALPEGIAAGIAEVVGLATEALNALAGALAGHEEGAPSPVRFPVFESFALFAQRARKAIRAMPDEAQAELEALQPYHNIGGPRGHPLWLLVQLADPGARRLAAGAVSGGSPLGINTKRKVELSGDLQPRMGAFADGAVIASVRATVVGPDPKLDMHLVPEFELAFSAGGPLRGAAVLDTLRDVCDHLEQVVLPRLEPYLPASPSQPLSAP